MLDSKKRRTFAGDFEKNHLRRWAAPQHKTSFLHSVCTILATLKNVRDLAQLVAHTSGGREVAGSSPVIPTEKKELKHRCSNSFSFSSKFVQWAFDMMRSLYINYLGCLRNDRFRHGRCQEVRRRRARWLS